MIEPIIFNQMTEMVEKPVEKHPSCNFDLILTCQMDMLWTVFISGIDLKCHDVLDLIVYFLAEEAGSKNT